MTVLEPVATGSNPSWVAYLELDLDRMEVVGWQGIGGATVDIKLPCKFHWRDDGTTYIESTFIVSIEPIKQRFLVISENP